MKSAIIYSSLTGNTKMIAEAIYKVMPEGAEIYSLKDAPAPGDFDFLALGYWVTRGTASEAMLKYMQNVKNKKIALFCTLGAYPDSEHAKKAIFNTAQVMPSCELLGHFICHGKVSEKLRADMAKNPGRHHPMTPERKARLEEAAKHPNEQDCLNAQAAFKEILSKIS